MYYSAIGTAQPSNLDEALSHYGRVYIYAKVYDNNMEPAKKTQWITALRSGDYNQVQGYLSKFLFEKDGLACKPGHCCLGVLADIEGVEKISNVVGDTRVGYRFPMSTQLKVLDPTWAESLGIETRTGRFTIQFKMFDTEFHQEHELAVLNDDDFSFNQIADIIEYFF